VSNVVVATAVRSNDEPAPLVPVLRAIARLCGDAGLLLLVLFLFPLVILAAGTPLALLVRAVLEIARRFS